MRITNLRGKTLILTCCKKGILKPNIDVKLPLNVFQQSNSLVCKDDGGEKAVVVSAVAGRGQRYLGHEALCDGYRVGVALL